ncbi:MAG: hypothetical protein JWN44_2606, partial [Myxococcales bacterium]|nr:hypothetical protein [Myxococcales bacterium]
MACARTLTFAAFTSIAVLVAVPVWATPPTP